MTENKMIVSQAKDALKGKWGLAIGTFVVYAIVGVALQVVPFIGSIAYIIISGAMLLGLVYFTLSISRNKEAKLYEDLKTGNKPVEA